MNERTSIVLYSLVSKCYDRVWVREEEKICVFEREQTGVAGRERETQVNIGIKKKKRGKKIMRMFILRKVTMKNERDANKDCNCC